MSGASDYDKRRTARRAEIREAIEAGINRAAAESMTKTADVAYIIRSEIKKAGFYIVRRPA